jgi:predicted O-methyltransferase YrrM
MQAPNPEITRVSLHRCAELEHRSPMTQERWSAVDRYVADLLVPSDPALDAALAANAVAGLPAHDVSPVQGRLLEILARVRGARRVLEIGTLGGYSTIWLARGLAPGGRLVTLERDPARADVARGNLARAGLAGVAEVRVGRAREALPVLAAEDEAPFDLVFVDADKESAAEYARWALRLTAPGSAIVFDNVVRGGALADAGSDDARVRGVRALHEVLADAPGVCATTIQTVGAKGYDGFTLALVGG